MRYVLDYGLKVKQMGEVIFEGSLIKRDTPLITLQKLDKVNNTLQRRLSSLQALYLNAIYRAITEYVVAQN